MSRFGRRRPADVSYPPGLWEDVVVMALAAWDVPCVHDASHNVFEIFLWQDRDFAACWREHEVWLRAEAVRRGIEPTQTDRRLPNRPPMFFGECLAELERHGIPL